MIQDKLQFGNKYNNLTKLKQEGVNIPNFTIYNSKKNLYLLNHPLILRSSFSLEDGLKNSFAGIFESYFPIYNENDLNKGIDFCNQSLKSYKFINYISHFNINISDIKINYILQEFIIGDISGVIFSDIGNNKMRIEFVPGLNFIITDGKIVNSNIYIINRSNFDDLEIESIYLEDYIYTIYENKINKKALDESYLFNFMKIKDKLCKIALDIEKIFGFSQDIEFTIKGNNIFILQSRNITS